MLVRDYMTRKPFTLQVDSDYKAAIKLMQDCAIHHLPVVDAAGRLAGIVAERDLLLAALHYLGSGVDIGEVMHSDVVTTTPDQPVTDAALLMAGHAIGGLPVLDRTGRVVGIITETDIFRAFVESCRQASTLPARRAKSTAIGADAGTKKRLARASSAARLKRLPSRKRGAKKSR
jgi:acetoin utilization protein AcuB